MNEHIIHKPVALAIFRRSGYHFQLQFKWQSGRLRGKKEIKNLVESFKSQIPELAKELSQLIKSDDPNVLMLYSRRCLEVIITDLCERELNKPRKTDPLKGIIDKLNKEEKVPSHIITSNDGLNSLSTYGAHPKDFDPEQVNPVLSNLAIILKWYLRYKGIQIPGKDESGQAKPAIEQNEVRAKVPVKLKKKHVVFLDRTYLNMGRNEEAIKMHQKLAELYPNFGPPYLCLTYIATGHREEAERILQEIEKKEVIPIVGLNRAKNYAALGRKDEAFIWLNYGPHQGWAEWVVQSQEFDKFHDDPRWDDFLKNSIFRKNNQLLFKAGHTSDKFKSITFIKKWILYKELHCCPVNCRWLLFFEAKALLFLVPLQTNCLEELIISKCIYWCMQQN